jgi:hypothetical protein
MKNC